MTSRASRLLEDLKTVDLREGSVDQRAVTKMKENEKDADNAAHKSAVKAASKAANSGEAMARLQGISKAVGDSRMTAIISDLLKIRAEYGHTPEWYSAAIDDVGGDMAFALIFKHGFTKEDMDSVAWGLSLQACKDYGIDRK